MRSGPAMITTPTMSVPMMLFLIDCFMLFLQLKWRGSNGSLRFVDWLLCAIKTSCEKSVHQTLRPCQLINNYILNTINLIVRKYTD